LDVSTALLPQCGADRALPTARAPIPPAPLVLLIAPQPFFQWRGAAFRVRYTAQALVELGYRVDLLTLPIGKDVDLPGVRLLRVANPLGMRDIPIGPSVHKGIFDALLLHHAVRLTARRRYDVLHCLEDAGFIGSLLRGRARRGFVYDKLSDLTSFHSGRLQTFLLRRYATLETRVLRQADVVIVNAQRMLEPALAAGHQRVCHIPDLPSSFAAPNPAAAAEFRARLVRSPEEVLALFVGSFAPYQGIDLLFEAMAIAHAAQPWVRFVVIGGSNAELEERRRWLQARGLADAVILVGKVHPDTLPACLAAADVLLLPRTAGDNVPLKLFDYLRAGRAIVATDITANRALLDEDKAVLTEPTPARFAAGIVRLAGDPQLRARLGARARIEQSRSYAGFKRQLADCYASLPAPPRRGQRPAI
jgi:glycosyltransferase involved in cell wall biosynthesis